MCCLTGLGKEKLERGREGMMLLEGNDYLKLKKERKEREKRKNEGRGQKESKRARERKKG